MTDPRVLILANPFSGTGPNRLWVEGFAAQLRAMGQHVQTVWDSAQRSAALGAARDAGQSPTVVAAGGDGSISAVINDMAAQGVLGFPFATLPVGNENLFARHFKTRRDDGGALAAAVARGQTRPMDLGWVGPVGQTAGDVGVGVGGAVPGAEVQTLGESGGLLFTLMLGAGIDAEVIHRVDRWRHATADGGALRRVNWWRYAPRIGGALRSYRYPLVKLTPDGGEPVIGAHAFVFNLPEYGKDLGLCRAARGDDGVLDWVVLRKPGRLALASYLRAVATGRHLDRADVRHGRASSLMFEPHTRAAPPAPLQADGDPAGTTPVQVKVLPAALRVVVP